MRALAITLVAAAALTACGGSPKVDVLITSDDFVPARVVVKSGQTVTWQNMERDYEHNIVVADSEVVPDFKSPTLDHRDKYSRRFVSRGLVRYTCTIYADMDGTVEVR